MSQTQNQEVQGIAADNVTQWMAEHIDGLAAPLSFELIAGGHSNLTYSVVDQQDRTLCYGDHRWGMFGSAHDMGREHKIITALAGSQVPVASTIGLCADVSVNDAPFYVMDYVAGPVLHDAEVACGAAVERSALGEHVVDVLAALHQIDPDTVGLGDLGRKEAYLQRQLKRWSKQWEATETRRFQLWMRVPIVSRAHAEQIGASIVHGDYRLGNIIVGDGQVKAVLVGSCAPLAIR